MSQILSFGYKFLSLPLLKMRKQTLQNKLKFVDSMPMQEFEKELKSIDTKYPFSVPTGMQLSVQIVVGLFSFGHY